MPDLSALWREDATADETIEVYQFLIDNGQVWLMEGSVGRTASRLIEDGICTLGPRRVKDYWGNTIPGRYDVVPGTKGSLEYVGRARSRALMYAANEE